jgi:hypothetical protein
MIGLRGRRNEQCFHAGGGKRDRAHKPSRASPDNRDFGSEGGFHRDPTKTELRIHTPVENP